MDDVSTMRPAALFFRWGRAALMLNSIPLRFVANTSSQALSLISSNVTGGKMPAFAQRMSTPPNSAATVAMTSSISPCSLTSPRQNITALPRLRRASAVAAPSGSFRPSKQTRAPSWAKTPAMPLPMPLVPPVTMNDLFRIDVSTESSLFIRSASVSGGLFSGSQLTLVPIGTPDSVRSGSRRTLAGDGGAVELTAVAVVVVERLMKAQAIVPHDEHPDLPA